MSNRKLKKEFIRSTNEYKFTPNSFKDRCFSWRYGFRHNTFKNDDGKNPALSVACMQYADAVILDYEPETHEIARYFGWKDGDGEEKALELEERYYKENPFSGMWDDGNRQGLLLVGGCGTGKTYMAAAIANELCNANLNVVMLRDDELRNYMYDSEDGKIDDEDLIGYYLNNYFEKTDQGGILIIDDLFSHKTSDFALLLFDMMITKEGMYPIVITANLTKEQLINPPADKARIISRLRELCTVVETGTRDRRSLVMASCMNPQSDGKHSK